MPYLRSFSRSASSGRWLGLLPRRKRALQMHELDLTNLPPDTFVVYPDRLGNYHFDQVELTQETADSFEVAPEFLARIPEVSETGARELGDISALDRNWISLRPVIGYGMAGFAVCLLMFLSAKTPASSPAVASQQQGQEQRTALAKESPPPAERNLRRAGHNESRYYGPEVIVHHYQQVRAVPETTGVKIKKYSDWR